MFLENQINFTFNPLIQRGNNVQNINLIEKKKGKTKNYGSSTSTPMNFSTQILYQLLLIVLQMNHCFPY